MKLTNIVKTCLTLSIASPLVSSIGAETTLVNTASFQIHEYGLERALESRPEVLDSFLSELQSAGLATKIYAADSTVTPGLV